MSYGMIPKKRTVGVFKQKLTPDGKLGIRRFLPPVVALGSLPGFLLLLPQAVFMRRKIPS
jgi:hypothetical protein